MRWFVRQFGVTAARGEVALPTPVLIRPGYAGTARDVDELVTRVCAVMSVDPARIAVALFDRSAAEARAAAAGRTVKVAQYHRRYFRRSVVALDRAERADPAVLAAIIAHELGHARLLGEGRTSVRYAMHEQLTDLVTVFLGMGVFTANAAVLSPKPVRSPSVGRDPLPFRRVGYLSQPAFGYALACLCGLRRETKPPWAVHLKPGPRSQLEQSLDYFACLAAAGR